MKQNPWMIWYTYLSSLRARGITLWLITRVAPLCFSGQLKAARDPTLTSLTEPFYMKITWQLLLCFLKIHVQNAYPFPVASHAKGKTQRKIEFVSRTNWLLSLIQTARSHNHGLTISGCKGKPNCHRNITKNHIPMPVPGFLNSVTTDPEQKTSAELDNNDNNYLRFRHDNQVQLKPTR